MIDGRKCSRDVFEVSRYYKFVIKIERLDDGRTSKSTVVTKKPNELRTTAMSVFFRHFRRNFENMMNGGIKSSKFVFIEAESQKKLRIFSLFLD